MFCIGIEGTAHTIGVGIIDFSESQRCTVLSDVRNVYKPASGSGIIPRDASQFISDKLPGVLHKALERAGVGMRDIGLVAFSAGPGMGHCLRTAATAARAISLHYKIPIIGVNHCIAHLEIARVTSGRWLRDEFDPLCVYVSGGNTQILKLKGKYYRIFGETLDIGLGNMLDKFGRVAGFEHPAGPRIEELARCGKRYIRMPYTVKGTDLSFSGLLTKAVNIVKKASFSSGKSPGNLSGNFNENLSGNSQGNLSDNFIDISDVCYCLQETAFSMLCEVTERALAHLNPQLIVLGGGVANNKRLAQMIGNVAKDHSIEFEVPEKYCSDNGVMIAYLGALMHNGGIRHEIGDTCVRARYRSDEVAVKW